MMASPGVVLPRISVVVAALNEADNIEACLASARAAGALAEIIVVDGGSSDGTVDLARRAGASVIEGSAGRAAQQNAGARQARGEVLLFLHADTRLPEGWTQGVLQALEYPGNAGGAFTFAVDAPGYGLRFIEAMANLRSRVLQMPYGDQALFVSRKTFFELGCFPEIAIMEDFALARRLRRSGRVVTLKPRVLTSPRRWKRLGLIRTTLLNQVMVSGFLLGVSPVRLAQWYQRPRE